MDPCVRLPCNLKSAAAAAFFRWINGIAVPRGHGISKYPRKKSWNLGPDPLFSTEFPRKAAKTGQNEWIYADLHSFSPNLTQMWTISSDLQRNKDDLQRNGVDCSRLQSLAQVIQPGLFRWSASLLGPGRDRKCKAKQA